MLMILFFWNSSVNHVRCYCHKLALAVKHRPETMNISVGHVKPTTKPGASVPVPRLLVNTGNEDVNVQSFSDKDDAAILPPSNDPD